MPHASSPTAPDHPHALAVASLFGLSLPLHRLPRERETIAPPEPGEILLLTGPSGAGKTTALRTLASAAVQDRRVIDLARVRLRQRPAVAHFPRLAPEAAMRALAAAGLADARAMLKPPAQLSLGQRWRLALAIALNRARGSRGPALIIADEFASTLDDLTARAVARLLRRAVDRHPRLAAAVATTRNHLATQLAPDRHTRFRLAAPPVALPPTPRPAPLPLRFRQGSTADYQALAPIHYLPGRPASIERVLTARCQGELAAVLTISRPTLNSRHRQLAWPGRFAGRDKRAAAQRVNREIRTISRVIVDPRFQGLGVARRLVARYLADPVTPCTEALAAMGAVSPFFARAGMTAYALPPSRRNARLIDALAHANLAPHDLARPDHSLRRARAASAIPFLDRELRRWAAASGATDRRAKDPIETLWRLAAARLAPVVAYAHTAD
jgi:ABC-type lipoprotein export system ATPase subunit/GNAT superfamily N-acetyltransferase